MKDESQGMYHGRGTFMTYEEAYSRVRTRILVYISKVEWSECAHKQ